jgi:hypothetical protein
MKSYYTILLHQTGSGSTTYAIRYFSTGSILLSSAEATVQATLPYRLRITRIFTKMSVNSVNGNTVIALRDDGITVTGSSFTIATTDIAEKDSGALNVVIDANSKINFMIDTSASSTGSWLFSHYIVYGYIEG